MAQSPGINFFNDNAQSLAAQYNAADRRVVHADLVKHMPASEGLSVLDIGSGSGVDAGMFARMGHVVTAVEPAESLMQLAQRDFQHKSITWVSDTLPEISSQVENKFDVISAIGVLQYLGAEDRPKALSRIFALAARGAIIDIQYPETPSREHQFVVGQDEMEAAVWAHPGMSIVVDRSVGDSTGRMALNGAPLSFRSFILRKAS